MSYYNYWGKADLELNYHLLPYHSLDVAAVGEVLFKENPNLLNKFSDLTRIEKTIFHKLFIFFLSIHDLGKFSDAFQGQIKEIYTKLYPNQTSKVYNIRHDSLGYILWEKEFFIKQRKGFSGRLKESNFFNLNSEKGESIKYFLNILIAITTGHHGRPPSKTGYTHNTVPLDDYFTQNNKEDSFQFLTETYKLFFREEDLIHFEKYEFDSISKNLKDISFWLAGLSVLCDWIGSNKDIFLYKSDSIPLETYWKEFAIPRAEEAIKKAGILPSKVSSYTFPTDLFKYLTTPTPLQNECHSLELKKEPQLFILEDVTGSGKTEAALILAKRLMLNNGYDGLFIGLPTMATSNGMYSRVASFYKKIYEQNTNPSLVLAHGAKNLSSEFSNSILYDSKSKDKSYSKDEESASASCASWLADSSKKSMLSDVAIGTIDQALISILLSKFQSLRLIGLMNKVLILDEIHAYDSYMNGLIKALLKAQARIGGSVILLSATLPENLKKEFISAFQKPNDEDSQDNELNNHFPLITQVYKNSEIIFKELETREEVKRTVKINFLHKEEDIYSLIQKSLDEKKSVCWIRNTVSDAMNSYEYFSNKLPKENLILFHARFAMGDRLDKEKNILSTFGKISNSEIRNGKLVIATQVIEQSLDLDFDVMISDIAPIDLIIQRAGRLHRHTRDENGNRIDGKDKREKPILYIHSPEITHSPNKNWFSAFLKGSSFVYPDHGKIFLTTKILFEKGELKMPEEARNLIEFVYSEKEKIPDALIEITNENNNKNNQKAAQAGINQIKFEDGYTAVGNNSIWDDVNAPTRLGEESIKITLAKFENGKLSSWYKEGDFPWANSEVSVMSYILNSEWEDYDSILKNQIKICKEKLPNKGKYSVLIPLKLENGNWIGFAKDKKGEQVKCFYNSEIGFKKIKEGEEI